MCRIIAFWAVFKGFRAIILHTFGVQVDDSPKPLQMAQSAIILHTVGDKVVD